MAKINAEGVVSDAALSESPVPVEPDDLTPKPEKKQPEADPVMVEDDGVPAPKSVSRARAKK